MIYKWHSVDSWRTKETKGTSIEGKKGKREERTLDQLYEDRMNGCEQNEYSKM